MWRYKNSLNDFIADYHDFNREDASGNRVNFAGVKSVPGMWIDDPENPNKWLTVSQLNEYAYKMQRIKDIVNCVEFDYDMYKKHILDKKKPMHSGLKREHVL